MPRSVPVLALALLLLSAPLALAAPLPPVDGLVVAGPVAWVLNYLTQAVVISPGGDITFLNLDVMEHNVVAFALTGPPQPWCGPGEEFTLDECPLFWSPRTPGLGGQSQVLGLENLQPGRVYSYFCSPHPVMRGTLVVAPEAPAP